MADRSVALRGTSDDLRAARARRGTRGPSAPPGSLERPGRVHRAQPSRPVQHGAAAPPPAAHDAGEGGRTSRPHARQRRSGPVESGRSGAVVRLMGDSGRDRPVWVAAWSPDRSPPSWQRHAALPTGSCWSPGTRTRPGRSGVRPAPRCPLRVRGPVPRPRSSGRARSRCSRGPRSAPWSATCRRWTRRRPPSPSRGCRLRWCSGRRRSRRRPPRRGRRRRPRRRGAACGGGTRVGRRGSCQALRERYWTCTRQ